MSQHIFIKKKREHRWIFLDQYIFWYRSNGSLQMSVLGSVDLTTSSSISTVYSQYRCCFVSNFWTIGTTNVDNNDEYGHFDENFIASPELRRDQSRSWENCWTKTNIENQITNNIEFLQWKYVQKVAFLEYRLSFSFSKLSSLPNVRIFHVRFWRQHLLPFVE